MDIEYQKAREKAFSNRANEQAARINFLETAIADLKERNKFFANRNINLIVAHHKAIESANEDTEVLKSTISALETIVTDLNDRNEFYKGGNVELVVELMALRIKCSDLEEHDKNLASLLTEGKVIRNKLYNENAELKNQLLKETKHADEQVEQYFDLRHDLKQVQDQLADVMERNNLHQAQLKMNIAKVKDMRKTSNRITVTNDNTRAALLKLCDFYGNHKDSDLNSIKYQLLHIIRDEFDVAIDVGKIEAIIFLRKIYSIGLKEAKEMVEDVIEILEGPTD